jgi:hypothetical protein
VEILDMEEEAEPAGHTLLNPGRQRGLVAFIFYTSVYFLILRLVHMNVFEMNLTQ